MIHLPLATGQDMIHVHHTEGEVSIAAHTHAFLFTVEAVAVDPVVGQVSEPGQCA